MAQPFVNEIKEQQRVHGTFVAVRKSLLHTKGGAPYLAVTLADRTGEMEGRVWDEAERFDQAFERGAYVEVDGFASIYGGRIQLKVDGIRPVAREEVNPRDFLPVTRFDVDLMWKELRTLVDGVGDPLIRALLISFVDDPAIGPLLRQAPAAKNVHHPFVGGLLEHTLSVMQLAHRIADHYPRANRDLLVAGALLHDLGKTRELTVDQGFDYTTEGRLVGHLLITIQWIHEKAAQIPGFPPELEMHLTHLVAAHHGELEHGSPKVPHTLEAMLVHALDELDSRVQSWTMIMDRDAGEEWTSFQRLYDRFLFKGPGWGRERLGLPAAPEGTPWQGLSLYRREALGLTQASPPRPTPEPAESSRPRPPRKQQTDEQAGSPEPSPIDLFSRAGPRR
jgi:3'-5' exoribonuclease